MYDVKEMFLSEDMVTAEKYLSHKYALSAELPSLPLPDEAFVAIWQRGYEQEQDVITLLQTFFAIDMSSLSWQNPKEMYLHFVQTLAGMLPVIEVNSHGDFIQLEGVLNARPSPISFPQSINAFTIQARAKNIYHHRLLLLNKAPYSAIPAIELGLSIDTWLAKSMRLRLWHECTHYEMWRLLGGVANHPLDEIIADAAGQIAAFGHFDAALQRKFFGLSPEGKYYGGRLGFYCQCVDYIDWPVLYKKINSVLDIFEQRINFWLSCKEEHAEIIMLLAEKSILEWLEE